MAKPTILAVDDDPVVSKAITRDLRDRFGADFRVAGATSGPGALELLTEFTLRGRAVALVVSESSWESSESLSPPPQAGSARASARANGKRRVRFTGSP